MTTGGQVGRRPKKTKLMFPSDADYLDELPQITSKSPEKDHIVLNINGRCYGTVLHAVSSLHCGYIRPFKHKYLTANIDNNVPWTHREKILRFHENKLLYPDKSLMKDLILDDAWASFDMIRDTTMEQLIATNVIIFPPQRWDLMEGTRHIKSVGILLRRSGQEYFDGL